MKHRITAALERFSRAMLAPLSYLSAAGLLLVVGALLTSAPLAGVLPFLRWEPVQLAGRIIYKCLTAVISNLSVLFCTGLAAALAKREKHQAAFIALMSYLVYLTAGNVTLTELGLLAQPDALTGLYSAGQTMVLGIQTVDTGVFGGILLGLLTAFVYDRTCEKAHRGILGGVFSGVRWSFACVAALAAVLGFGACFVWPPIQKAIAAVTGFIAASGNIGLFLYGFLERLLIPTGLHHLVYMPFQFSQLGGQLMVGSVTYTGAYVVMMTEYNLGLPFSDGIVWMYTGFTKTFGYFGIAAAFIFCARRGSRKKTALQLLPLAFTASLASITEPLDFLFCFSAPVLWLAHAAISGSFIVLLHLCGVTAFTSNLLGSLVMNLSAGAARTNYPVLYLLGLAQIAVYFVVFTVLIKALDLPTPGRRPEEPSRPEKALPLDEQGIEKLIAAFGGRENIRTVDNCFTRLRVTVNDPAFVKEQALKALPCSGVVQSGCDVQIVYGIRAPEVRQAVERRLKGYTCKNKQFLRKKQSLYRQPAALHPAPAGGCILAIWPAACWRGSAQKVRAGVSCCALRIWMPSAARASMLTCWNRIWTGWALRGTRAAAPAGRTAPITRVSARRFTPQATKSWKSAALCTRVFAPAPSCTRPARPIPRTATWSIRAPAAA